jgi:hypothetical protein
MKRSLLLLPLAAMILFSCEKDGDQAPTNVGDDAGPRLILKFRFDSTQARLDNFGQPASIPVGRGAQSPVFNRMSAHYVELAPNATTLLGGGDVVYHAPETDQGGSTAIDHALSLEVADGGEFLNIPLSELTPGTYQWLRVSLAYQNYTVKFRSLNLNLQGTIGSFIGYNTYIDQYTLQDSTVAVNGNRLQGYWGFEVNDLAVPITTGQAPPGATTVPNPINATSPIPAGSCVVTGAFPIPLTVTGNETEDVVIIVSLSTNKSFEWIETDADNVWEPLDGEEVRDMGVRGMIPSVQ